MRGKALRHRLSSVLIGITPAYAGKRQRLSSACTLPWDHPRVCGEKLLAMMVMVPSLGSPPRMRGKVFCFLRPCVSVGITPAYAGKSPFYRLNLHMLGDHPRVCGEKRLKELICDMAKGSPPRMRGKVKSELHPTMKPGITPAYAGKSSRPFRRKSKIRDHPRVCGEKLRRVLV